MKRCWIVIVDLYDDDRFGGHNHAYHSVWTNKEDAEKVMKSFVDRKGQGYDGQYEIVGAGLLEMDLDNSESYDTECKQRGWGIYKKKVEIPTKKCLVCNGSGQVWGISGTGQHRCVHCYGKGRLNDYN